MDILTVADCHGKLKERSLMETLAGRKPDVIFFLGDNETGDIELVQDVVRNVAMYGVAGNHDYPDILQKHGIEDLHRKTVFFDGFCIGGFGGTIKYKNDCTRLMFTNEESESLLSDLPKCDILITHDRPCFRAEKKIAQKQEEKLLTLFEKIRKFFAGKQDIEEVPTEYEPVVMTAHSGLTGIAQYIQNKQPSYHLHGHLHDKHIEMKYGTEIRCCYGTEFFTLEKNELIYRK